MALEKVAHKHDKHRRRGKRVIHLAFIYRILYDLMVFALCFSIISRYSFSTSNLPATTQSPPSQPAPPPPTQQQQMAPLIRQINRQLHTMPRSPSSELGDCEEAVYQYGCILLECCFNVGMLYRKLLAEKWRWIAFLCWVLFALLTRLKLLP